MPAPWTRRRAAAVALGGAMGAAGRWAVITNVDAGRFPWPVLAINLAGSLLLGIVLAAEWTHPRTRLLWHDFGGIGFCGGLTTFSTFAVEIAQLSRDGHTATAVLYGVVSVASALAAVVAGAATIRPLRALTMPLEETP